MANRHQRKHLRALIEKAQDYMGKRYNARTVIEAHDIVYGMWKSPENNNEVIIIKGHNIVDDPTRPPPPKFSWTCLPFAFANINHAFELQIAAKMGFEAYERHMNETANKAQAAAETTDGQHRSSALNQNKWFTWRR